MIVLIFYLNFLVSFFFVDLKEKKNKFLFILEAPSQHSEELLVHVLMALNNLSYYDDPQSYIIRNAETLAQCKIKF
jgi:hypothetical protein